MKEENRKIKMFLNEAVRFKSVQACCFKTTSLDKKVMQKHSKTSFQNLSIIMKIMQVHLNKFVLKVYHGG